MVCCYDVSSYLLFSAGRGPRGSRRTALCFFVLFISVLFACLFVCLTGVTRFHGQQARHKDSRGQCDLRLAISPTLRPPPRARPTIHHARARRLEPAAWWGKDLGGPRDWPGHSGLGLGGRCYWHGVGGFVFESPSSLSVTVVVCDRRSAFFVTMMVNSCKETMKETDVRGKENVDWRYRSNAASCIWTIHVGLYDGRYENVRAVLMPVASWLSVTRAASAVLW